jgi:hypothetical protein
MYEPLASVVGSRETKTRAEMESPGLVTEVAFTVTLKPGGLPEGAMKVVGVSLAVLEGRKAPQGVITKAQVTDQLTPLFEASPVTIAAMDVEAPTCIAFGGGAVELKARMMGGVVTTMVVEADLVVSAMEVAVTVTVLFVAEGRAEGEV